MNLRTFAWRITRGILLLVFAALIVYVAVVLAAVLDGGQAAGLGIS